MLLNRYSVFVIFFVGTINCSADRRSGGSDTGSGEDSGTDNDTSSDVDGGDTDTDADTDTDTNNSDTDILCANGVGWYDPSTDLCWQNPGGTEPIHWDEAVTYCEDLVLGGQEDWRLPKIQELISLLRGCVSGVSTNDLSVSTCGVNDPDCLSGDCSDGMECSMCSPGEGPCDDPDGCYWDPGIVGACAPDNYYWSSSLKAEDSTHVWVINFSAAWIPTPEVTGGSHTRCVRNGM
ncbi:MAG: DUF1566 domain-containing protein [Bacilli bacterium]|jgi:hypothetical protein